MHSWWRRQDDDTQADAPIPDYPPIRLVVADDSTQVRLLARLALEGTEGIHVVAEAANGEQCLAMVDEEQPDVVVLDVAMPVMDGMETLAEIGLRYPDIRVVMFSGFTDGDLAPRALSLGATAFVEKSRDLGDLTREIRRAATRGAA